MLIYDIILFWHQGGYIMKLNKGVLFILLGASFFGFTPIFAKLGFSYGYSLGQINIVQMVISFFLLWSFTLIKRSSFKGLNKKNVLQIMITGCFIGLTSIFYYGSMQYLPASLAIILMFQFVWIGIILEWIFSKIKPAPVTILSIILILIGVFFASNFVNGDIQGLPIKGFIFGILIRIHLCWIYFLQWKGRCKCGSMDAELFDGNRINHFSICRIHA